MGAAFIEQACHWVCFGNWRRAVLFRSDVLDLAIGLILIYFLLSMACSWINERIASLQNLRGWTLVEGVYGLLYDYAPLVLRHSLIAGLGRQGGHPEAIPAYVPPKQFALALADTLVNFDPLSVKRLATEADAVAITAEFDGLAAAIGQVADVATRTQLQQDLAAARKLWDAAARKPNWFSRWIRALSRWLRLARPRYPLLDFYDRAIYSAVDTALETLQGHYVNPAGTPSVAASALADVGKTAANLRGYLTAAPPTGRTPLTASTLRTAVQNIQPLDLRAALLPLVDIRGVEQDLAASLNNLEVWFSNAMDRLSGRYKRLARWRILIVALLVAVVMNGDTFAIGSSLWHNEAQRTASIAVANKLIAAATPTVQSTGNLPAATNAGPRSASAAPALVSGGANTDAGSAGGLTLPEPNLKDIAAQLDALKVPLGYASVDHITGKRLTWFGGDWWAENFGANPWPDLPLKLAGWLVTAAALSLGAAFWFDLLGKLVNLRSSGAPPKDSAAPNPGTAPSVGGWPSI